MKRIVMNAFFCFAVLASALALAGSAAAQEYDHLKCFKVKDTKTFKSATADLTVTGGHFAGMENCQIKPKAKEFCVPVDKSNVVVEEGAETPVIGQELSFDRLCYKVKCPSLTVPGPQAYADQFAANRELGGFKVSTICTPAVIGPVPVEPPPVWPADPQDYVAGPSSYLNTLVLPDVISNIPQCCKDFGSISKDKIEDNTDYPDNGLAVLANALSVFGINFQTTLDDGIADGSLVMLLDHPNLGVTALPDQFALVQMLGAFEGVTDFTLADQGLGTFLASAGAFVPGSGEPLNYYHPAYMDTDEMTAGPFTLQISLPLGFLSLNVPAQQGEINADPGAVSAAGVPYTNGTISGYVLLTDVFGTVNDILNSPTCSCLGHSSDIYVQLPNGSWDGNCITDPASLCTDPSESLCVSLSGTSLISDPPQVCGLLPNLLSNQADIDLNADPTNFEALSVGLQFTAVNAAIVGIAP